MKNIRREIVKINDLYKSQKFVALHHYQAAKQKTDAMIEAIRTIQIHDSIYVRKRE
jgi:hypothetical protein